MSESRTAYLWDAALLRPLAILLLILYHAFIPYVGGWPAPACFESNDVYWWIAKSSYSCMLELFVFISGYVFAQKCDKNAIDFKSVLLSKLKRLVLPSVLFSIAYVLFFPSSTHSGFWSVAYDVACGVGHMWFLPMLLWVTIISYALFALNLPRYVLCTLLILSPIGSHLPLPFQLDSACYYLPFFYVGMMVMRPSQTKQWLLSKKMISLFGIGFVASFALSTWAAEYLKLFLSGPDMWHRALYLTLFTYTRMTSASLGIAFLFTWAHRVMKGNSGRGSKTLLYINKYCFGVYLYQQFILRWAYYYSPIPCIVGPVWLPWIGSVLALVASFVLAWGSKQTRLGKLLI